MDQRIRCNHCDPYADTEYRLRDKKQKREELLCEPLHEHHRTDRKVRLRRSYVASSPCAEIRICERMGNGALYGVRRDAPCRVLDRVRVLCKAQNGAARTHPCDSSRVYFSPLRDPAAALAACRFCRTIRRRTHLRDLSERGADQGRKLTDPGSPK